MPHCGMAFYWRANGRPAAIQITTLGTTISLPTSAPHRDARMSHKKKCTAIMCTRTASSPGSWRISPMLLYIWYIHKIRTQRVVYLVATAALLQQLREPIGDQHRCVDEALDAIAEADFGFAIQFVGRLVDAFLPADLVEFVNLCAA